MELGSHCTNFQAISHLRIFRKSVEKIQVTLNSDENNAYLTRRLKYIFDHISFVSYWDKNVSDKVVRKIETHILCSLPPEKRAVYKVKWNKVVERGRTQITIWRMLIAGWIPKTTKTHSEYAIFTAFLLQQWMQDVTLYMHDLSYLQYCHRGALFSGLFVTNRYPLCLSSRSLSRWYIKSPKISYTYIWLCILLRCRANSLALCRSRPDFTPNLYIANCMVEKSCTGMNFFEVNSACCCPFSFCHCFIFIRNPTF